jgi:tetratricopeptide (TPR) repeat protein
VARGTQHRKRRPRANAVATAPVAARRHKQKPPQWQEELFFQRLRNHAKWIYVGLAVTFVLGFVLLGVGSGSTGIGDALQNAFNFGSNGGSSISSLQHKVAKSPNDAKAWRDLATAYEQKQRTADAVTALERLTQLHPKDTGTLAELASEYQSLSTTYGNEYSAAQTAAQAAAPSTAFAPPASSPFGKLDNDPNGLKDPISSAVSSVASAKASAAYTKLQTTATKAEDAYKKLAGLSPSDATLQIQLGQAAQTAGDERTALGAYKKFLKLAPNDPLAPQVKRVITALKQSAAASQTTTQASG